MVNLFSAGGAAMWVVTFLGIEALVAAILHAAFARKWSLIVSAAHLPLPLLVGAAGWLYGRAVVEEAASFAGGAAFALELMERGYAEARVPLVYGGISTAVCAIPFAVGVVRKARRAASSRV